MTLPSFAKSSHGAVAVLACALWGPMLPTAAGAQFSHVPTPLAAGAPRRSDAQSDNEYRRDAARRIYDSFPMHVFRGKMPPFMHAVAVTETDIAADGRVLAVRLTREPAAAKEVGPWVVALIRRVGRFPPLAQMEQVTYTDIWLVDKSGKFQLDTLTEGQHGQ
jgi:hypothetical protein